MKFQSHVKRVYSSAPASGEKSAARHRKPEWILQTRSLGKKNTAE